MKIFIQLRKITHLEDLEAQMKRYIEYQLKDLKLGNARVDVYASKAAPRTDFQNAMFEFHVTVKNLKFGKTIFSKNSGQDFWWAFAKGVKLIRNQIVKDHAKKESTRTKGVVYGFPVKENIGY